MKLNRNVSKFQAIGTTTLSKFVEKHKGVGDLIVRKDLRWQLNSGVFSNEHGLGEKVPFMKYLSCSLMFPK
jgi:hypothetical protein